MLKELKETVQRIKRKYENYLVSMKSLYFYRDM